MKRSGKSSGAPCVDVQSWRVPTKEEFLHYLKTRGPRSKGEPRRRKPSGLVVRHHLSPLDVYCYLKARFGEPNGFQNVLRQEGSDNWIHWDFLLKSGDDGVYICGMSREVHFLLSERMTDEQWRDLIEALKADYKRVGKEKGAILKAFERWVQFPNKFAEVADICAELHADIVDTIGGFQIYKTSSFRTKKAVRDQEKVVQRLTERSGKLYKSCIQLSLLTPARRGIYQYGHFDAL
jgi:hypothetical protein